MRKLWPQPLVICASAGYLARRGIPQTLADLPNHDRIAYSYQWAGEAWTFAAPDGPGELAVNLTRVSHR